MMMRQVIPLHSPVNWNTYAEYQRTIAKDDIRIFTIAIAIDATATATGRNRSIPIIINCLLVINHLP